MMRAADYARLLVLAAIWGSSFLFMRIAAPVLGPVVTGEARVLLAGATLLLVYGLLGTKLDLRRHWKGYLLLGLFNAAVPFMLFSYAAMHIPASLSAILNSTSPLFSAVLAASLGTERLNRRRAIGLALGFIGVMVISGLEMIHASPATLSAIGACLLSGFLYGYAAVRAARWTGDAPPRAVATGCLVVSGLAMSPALIVAPLPASATPAAIGSLLALALACTAFAYVLYFQLIGSIGATRALTVTYLIPLFGILWGIVFLGESLPPGAAVGGALVLLGTLIVTRH